MFGFLLRIFTAIVLTGISAYLSYRKPEQPDPGTEADFGNPRAEEGSELLKGFGTFTIADPQVVQFGNFRTERIQKTGGRKYGLFGPKQKTTVGFRYYLGIHLVLCLGACNSLNRIRIDKRIAFIGSSKGGRIEICKANLFGASDKEGGVTGELDVLMGEDDQGENDYLRRITTGPLPAHRGVTSLVLRQLYLGNAPSLRPWEVRLARTNKVDPGYNGGEQWRPDIAEIFQRNANPEGEAQDILIVIDTSLSMGGDRITNAKAAVVGLLESWQATLADQRLASIRILSWNTDVDDEIQIESASASDYGALIAFVNGMTLSGGNDLESAYQDAYDFFRARDLCKVRRMLFLTDGTSFDGVEPAIELYESLQNVKVAGFSIDTGVSADLAAVTDRAVRVDGGDADAIEAELLAAFAEYDLNAAHILREILLSPDCGGTGNEADADDSWDDAAETLFDEGFGLSGVWRGASDRADFKQEIERHVDARSYIDRRTGKWAIKLIRDDYDEDELPVFDKANVASWSNINFPQPGSLLNQLVVTWNDPEKDETTSLTISNPARIRMNGSQVFQEKVEYPFIQRADLAGRVAMRDLSARSAPLITGEFVTKNLPTDLNIGSAIIVHNPRIGLINKIVRITDIEDGNIRDSSARVKFLEDKFAIGDASALVIEVIPTPQDLPRPVSPRVVEEAPYFITLDRLGAPNTAEVLTLDADSGFLFVAGARPTVTSSQALVFRDQGAGYEELEDMAFSLGAKTLSALDARADRVKVVVESREDLLPVAVGSLAWLGGEHVAVDLVEEGDTSTGGDYWEPTGVPTDGLTIFTLTLKRGCLDTVPASHPDATSVVFYGGGGFLEDDIQKAADEIDVKLQTVTTRGVLSFTLAPVDEVTFASRPIRPNPPGRFKLNGAYTQDTIIGATTLTWVDRNRLTDTGATPVGHDDAGVTSEAGVTYFVRAEAFDEDGVLIDTFIEEDVGTDLTFDWDGVTPALPALTSYVDFSVASVRDGYESWQRPTMRAIVFLPPGDLEYEVL